MCELLVGLEAVDVYRVNEHEDELIIEVSSRSAPLVCDSCGELRRLKDRTQVSYVDLPSFGRSTRLVWNKRRWKPCCGGASETEIDVQIAAPRQAMTTRAGRWATVQVGLHRRSVASVAKELRCDWVTVNTAVISFGKSLLEADQDRVGTVEAIGLDETLFVRKGQRRIKSWATSIVDVNTGQLIDMVPARTAKAVTSWFDQQPDTWVQRIRFGVLDLSGPYRKVFNDVARLGASNS